MVTNEARVALRVVDAAVQQWVASVNDVGDVRRVPRADLDGAPTPERTVHVVSILVEHPLPPQVRARCTNPAEDEFRRGCFQLIRTAQDRGLRLHLIPLSGAEGEVDDSQPGLLVVRVGVGIADPFGYIEG